MGPTQTYWIIICIYQVMLKSGSTILNQWLSLLLTQWSRLGSFESCCLDPSLKDVDLIE